MAIEDTDKRLTLFLLKDFSRTHTITSLAKELGMSRVGVWKILKQLGSKKIIKLKTVGSGKTSTSIITVNFDNILTKKSLALYLTEESLAQERWQSNFSDLETETEFVILFGSILHFAKEANDIDIVIVAKTRNFIKIQKILDKIQKSEIRKIHNINFTEEEFRKELENKNKAFIEAIKKGTILFGQEKFVDFMKKVIR